jgi:hypothetical protein
VRPSNNLCAHDNLRAHDNVRAHDNLCAGDHLWSADCTARPDDDLRPDDDVRSDDNVRPEDDLFAGYDQRPRHHLWSEGRLSSSHSVVSARDDMCTADLLCAGNHQRAGRCAEGCDPEISLDSCLACNFHNGNRTSMEVRFFVALSFPSVKNRLSRQRGLAIKPVPHAGSFSPQERFVGHLHGLSIQVGDVADIEFDGCYRRLREVCYRRRLQASAVSLDGRKDIPQRR